MVIIQNGILPAKDTTRGEELKEVPGKQTAPPPSEFLSLFGSHGVEGLSTLPKLCLMKEILSS